MLHIIYDTDNQTQELEAHLSLYSSGYLCTCVYLFFFQKNDFI